MKINPLLIIVPAVAAYIIYKNSATPSKKSTIENLEKKIEQEPIPNISKEEPKEEPKEGFVAQSKPKDPDKGFIYDCSSFQITDEINARHYIGSLIDDLTTTNEFSDPDTINIYNLCLNILSKINLECSEKFLNNSLKFEEFIIINFLFKNIIKLYGSMKLGEDYENSSVFVNKILPQIIDIQTKIFSNIPIEELEFVEKMILEGKKYP